MGNILLFGTTAPIPCIPYTIMSWLTEYNKGGHKFIVGDRKGVDTAFHRALSSIGAIDNTTMYIMGNTYNNTYDIKEKKFITEYDSEKQEVIISGQDNDGNEQEFMTICGVVKQEDIAITRDWYEFCDRQMIKDCDLAICIYDNENKTTFKMIQLLNIMNKPCYVFGMNGNRAGQ